MAEVEKCLRCSAEMEWRHGTWQCPRCRLKLGCCEGNAPCDDEETRAPAAAGARLLFVTGPHPTR